MERSIEDLAKRYDFTIVITDRLEELEAVRAELAGDILAALGVAG